MTNIIIHEWNEDQFRNSQQEWNKLLHHSTSDPLFMSWEWQHTWWQAFSEPNMQLKLLAATNSAGELVGLAPLYLSKARSKKIIITRRLQFIGNCWRGKATMRTELLDFMTNTSCSKDVINAFFQYINKLCHWDELILSDLKKDSDTYKLLIKETLLAKCHYRHTEEYASFHIETTEGFADYLKQLGKNTRLRLFNRRKNLEKLGNVVFTVNQNDNIKRKFELLNQLHAKRWGNPVFTGVRLQFNETLAKLMAEKDALSFSTITFDDKPVSIQYNYVINNHKYNIQAGFDEDFHKKIALGYLHFGYEIEYACDNTITSYDLLAGEGKNTSYKAHLTKRSVRIINLQIIRNPVVKALYKLYDYFNR